MKTTRQIYCQYLLSSQINYTCTNLADHLEGLDHNSVYRYLKNEKLTPRLLWEKAKPTLLQSPNGYLIFDDTVADKSSSSEASDPCEPKENKPMLRPPKDGLFALKFNGR